MDLRRVYFENVQYAPARGSGGEADVTSMEEVYRYARSFSDQRAAQMVFASAGSLDLRENHSELSKLLFSVGIDSFDWNFSSGIVRVHNIQYADEFRICDSRSDVSGYLASCKMRRVPSLRIYCGSRALYEELVSDNARSFFAMLDAAGFGKVTVYHNDDTGMLRADPAE